MKIYLALIFIISDVIHLNIFFRLFSILQVIKANNARVYQRLFADAKLGSLANAARSICETNEKVPFPAARNNFISP